MTQLIDVYTSVSNPSKELCDSIRYSLPPYGHESHGQRGQVLVTKYAFGRKVSESTEYCPYDSPVLTVAQDSAHTIESILVNGHLLGNTY